jgi:preprotein translocase subunit SecF
MNIIHKENLKLPLQKHKTNQTGYKNQSFNKIQHNPEANTHKLSQNPQKVSIFACLNKKKIDANFEKKKSNTGNKNNTNKAVLENKRRKKRGQAMERESGENRSIFVGNNISRCLPIQYTIESAFFLLLFLFSVFCPLFFPCICFI